MILGVGSDLADIRRVAETLERFGQVTKAVVGIDAWDGPHSTVHGALSEHERETLREAGACAEVAGHSC